MHDARSVANEFIRRAQDSNQPITPLQVQKLVYYAHAWMLGIHGRPMIEDEIEVWRYGPVVPAVYYCLSRYRGDPIEEIIPLHRLDKKEYSKEEQTLLEAVFDKYGGLSGMELSARTHARGTPWHKAKSKGRLYISNNDIRKYYSNLVKKA